MPRLLVFTILKKWKSLFYYFFLFSWRYINGMLVLSKISLGNCKFVISCFHWQMLKRSLHFYFGFYRWWGGQYMATICVLGINYVEPKWAFLYELLHHLRITISQFHFLSPHGHWGQKNHVNQTLVLVYASEKEMHNLFLNRVETIFNTMSFVPQSNW